MNPKLQKVLGEIDKAKARIAEQQARLRELERQKTELENADIVALFRKEKLTENEFSEFVKAMRGQEAVPPPQAAPATAGGYRPTETSYQSEQEENG